MLKSILAITGAAVLMIAVPVAAVLVSIPIAIWVLRDIIKEEEKNKED